LEFKCLHSCAMHIDQHFEEVCVEQSIWYSYFSFDLSY
jgi:hypothetical protein